MQCLVRSIELKSYPTIHATNLFWAAKIPCLRVKRAREPGSGLRHSPSGSPPVWSAFKPLEVSRLNWKCQRSQELRSQSASYHLQRVMRFKSQIRNVNTFASTCLAGWVISDADKPKNFAPLWPSSARSRGVVSQMKKSDLQ